MFRTVPLFSTATASRASLRLIANTTRRRFRPCPTSTLALTHFNNNNNNNNDSNNNNNNIVATTLPQQQQRRTLYTIDNSSSSSRRRRRSSSNTALKWLGVAVLGGMSLFALYALYEIRRSEPVSENQLALLKKLPLKSLSRLWGTMYSIEVPRPMRSLFYRGYCLLFNGDASEAALPLHEYRSLQEFFTRDLKPGLRPMDEESRLVSPVDGKVMAVGRIEWEELAAATAAVAQQQQHDQSLTAAMIEQVKGLKYPVNDLLGAVDAHVNSNEKSSRKDLHYCVLYLAPGDYHRYHSPCDWTVDEQRHVTGFLFPVMPLAVRKVTGLFSLNERVVLSGNWNNNKDRFHYVIVGATNVGSITLNHDIELKTNLRETEVVWRKNNFEKDLIDVKGVENLQLKKGDDLGCFQMGSTIVLVFEADSSSEVPFEFAIKPNERVRLGQSLVVKHPPPQTKSKGE